MALSGADTAQVLTAIGVIITAVGGAVAAIFGGYALIIIKRTEASGTRREAKLDEVHTLTNGMSERNEAFAARYGADQQMRHDNEQGAPPATPVALEPPVHGVITDAR